MIEIDALSLISSKLRQNQYFIKRTDFFDELQKMDFKVYEKMYRRNVDYVDVLSMVIFTHLSVMYDYDYKKMVNDLKKN